MNSAYARDDGTVRVAVERPVGLGFDHAECFLPTVIGSKSKVFLLTIWFFDRVR